MTWEDYFLLANQLAAAGWLILIFGPRRFALLNLVPAKLVPAALGAAYLLLVSLHFAASGGGYGSLAEVRTLLSGDAMLLAGWTHYLAFDLFVGAWIARRCDRAGTSRWVQGPVLFTTFLFGPVGLLLYYALCTGPTAGRQAAEA